ncbi:MAG: sugar-transfer associated ATP-grasp domain-containing protein [Leeuwenhoekiella sp.]
MALNKYLGRINVVANDSSKKKNLFQIGKEVINLTIADSKVPLHYASKFLYRKESGNYKNYLTTEEEVQVRFSQNLHSLAFHTLLKNKLSSALYFEECGLSIPKMYLHNTANLFFTDVAQHVLNTKEQLIKLLKQVFETQNIDSLFAKELAESGGSGCFLIKKNNLEKQIGNIGDELLKKSFVYQETIQQHSDLVEIHPNSLNTIRFETYIDKKGKTHIVSCYIRFGVGTSVVDNAGAGGFFMAIDKSSGKLKGKGYQKLKADGGARLFTQHPDSNYKLENFEIPHFEKACDLVFDAVSYVPERYVGWDIAIGEEGPVLIEGNAAPHIILGDIAYGGYKNHPLYEEILEEAYKKPIHTDKIMYFKNMK